MNWTKVTDALPPLGGQGVAMKPVWVTVLNEETGRITVQQTVFVYREAQQNEIGTVPPVCGFGCEFDLTDDFYNIYSVIEKKKGVKVTHWAYVEKPMPAPAEDEEDL